MKKTVAKIERDSREKVIKALKVQAKKTVAMARTLDFFKFVSTDKRREFKGKCSMTQKGEQSPCF